MQVNGRLEEITILERPMEVEDNYNEETGWMRSKINYSSQGSAVNHY